ncbi:MAG: carboxyl transferase domain-containing protein [Dehalococcoidia bacterium]
MTITNLLIANRGEIAIRIARAAADLGIPSTAIYSEDDATSLHTRKADRALQLKGTGAVAYLDGEQILELAKSSGCDAIHPGYGFLSENAGFARRCQEEGITFVGPSPEILELFGDKVRSRELAERLNIPVLRGSGELATPADASAFFDSLDAGKGMILKAIAGGGGRGSRTVETADEIERTFQRCQSEALAAFGNGAVFAEEYLPRARHVEIQMVGDAAGAASHLWERECSIQRRFQKVIEVAPSPGLSSEMRALLTDAAVAMARTSRYRSLGTFEFLVDANTHAAPGSFYFMEVNPRLQVEHTVTEEVLGIDLVQAQLRIAGGASLGDLGLTQVEVPAPRGFAIQCRVNLETMTPEGNSRPSGGLITAFEPPTGPGMRTDTFGYAGYTTSNRYDSLLAKVITHSPSRDFSDAVARSYRALTEFRIDGVGTNIPFVQNVLKHPDFTASAIYTRFVDDHIAELASRPEGGHSRLYFEPPGEAEPAAAGPRHAGVKVDATDPLAVLNFGKSGQSAVATAPLPKAAPSFTSSAAGPEGTVAVESPVQGTVVEVNVAEGDLVRSGQQLLVMEAMKMEHVVAAAESGVVRRVNVAPGDTLFAGQALLFVEPQDVADDGAVQAAELDLDYIRPDLALIHERHAITLDAARPDAVARRRKTGQRTARENIDDLCDPGTFAEHGSLVLTPGTGLPVEEVIKKFPTDGMVTGIGTVNGRLFSEPASRAVVLAYDYTVLAGTQGAINHPKTDRMLELAERWRLPVVFFTEGGGGRAGTGGQRPGGRAANASADIGAGRPLDTPTFATMGRLSGLVPLIGVTSGRCFAGNAALLGCCDVIIATENSNIGMGGPAMVEGGSLGVFAPEDIGPMEVQVPNGTVDIAVKDEAEAVEAARRYLSYFQGSVAEWTAPDQRILRTIIPENRLRMYDIRKVIETLADTGSFLELRRNFGLGMVTGFIRLEGRPVGVLANNPAHLAGAIDSDGSDKAARFMQLCDAFDIPLLVLCDTPGMMVGPEVEKTALVRHCSRLFVTGANLTIPHVTIVLRKAYGLGAQAMAGGSMKEPSFAVAWPTGEFGGMGLEGQVKLGFRNELAAIEDPAARLTRYNDLVARAYERSRAINYGVSFGVDDVIDPADSRYWIGGMLRSIAPPPPRTHKKRQNVDTW